MKTEKELKKAMDDWLDKVGRVYVQQHQDGEMTSYEFFDLFWMSAYKEGYHDCLVEKE